MIRRLLDVDAENIGARSSTVASRCERASFITYRRVATIATSVHAGNGAIWHAPPGAFSLMRTRSKRVRPDIFEEGGQQTHKILVIAPSFSAI